MNISNLKLLRDVYVKIFNRQLERRFREQKLGFKLQVWESA